MLINAQTKFTQLQINMHSGYRFYWQTVNKLYCQLLTLSTWINAQQCIRSINNSLLNTTTMLTF